MDNNFLIVTREELVGVADAIREKGEISKALQWPEEFKTAIGELSGTPEDEYRDSDDVIISGPEVKVAAGYYEEEIIKNVQVVEQATPTININGSGLITAEVSQIEGYVEEGIKSNTKQLTTQAAKTITPTTSEQIAVNAGVYTTGAIKVNPIPSNYITTTDATAVAGDILSGKTAYVNGSKVTGSIASKSSNDLSVNGPIVNVPAGYYPSQASKTIASGTAATDITLTTTDKRKVVVGKNDNGIGGHWIVTNSDNQIRLCTAIPTSGYYEATGDIIGFPITTVGAKTITPNTSNQVMANRGIYTTGDLIVKGDANLKAANIKKGVSIFGVAGSAISLNLSVVGGTSQPTSPAANTIWINTNVAISEYGIGNTPTANFLAQAKNGSVWIFTGTNDKSTMDISTSGNILIYPMTAKQFVNGTLVSRTVYAYINGVWINTSVKDLYKNGDQCIDITGGWTNSGYGVSGVSQGRWTQYGITDTYIYTQADNLDYDVWGGVLGTNNKIDLTGYTTLRIKGTISSGWIATHYIGLSLTKTASKNSLAYISFTGNQPSQPFEKTITIPNGVDSAYIFMLSYISSHQEELPSYGHYVSVSEMSLE